MDCSKLSTRADDARCEKQCSKKRDCLRHKCGQKCCILLEHVCPLVITIFNKTHFFHAKNFFRQIICLSIFSFSLNSSCLTAFYQFLLDPFFHAKTFFVKSHALVLKFCHLTIFFTCFEFQVYGRLL